MGMFKRLTTMFEAKVNGALDDIENPIELLDQKIRDMEESLNKAKLSSAQILGNVHENEKKMNAAKKAMEDFDNKVKLAIDKGDEELAKKALQRKIEEEKKYNTLKVAYEDSKTKGEAIKKKLQDLEAEIAKTRSYRDEATARYNNAEASKKVNEILANVDAGDNRINLDDIERKIEKKEALAEGLADLKTPTLEDDFKKLEEVDLDEELKKYKNK